MSDDRRPSLSLAHRVRPREPGRETHDVRPPLLVLLHGVGSNELAMAALMDWFDPRFIVISARSPIELEPFAFAWLHVTFTPDGPIIEGDEAVAACRTSPAFIDEAVAAYGADPEARLPRRVQPGRDRRSGHACSPRPRRLAGVVCMSGRLPPELLPHVASPGPAPRQGGAASSTAVHDQTLGVAYARSARAVLEKLPLDLDYREFEMGHTTTDESMAVVARLADRAPRALTQPRPASASRSSSPSSSSW